MSRGLGKVQRACLACIEDYEQRAELPTTFNIAADVYQIKRNKKGERLIRDAQHVAVKRAIDVAVAAVALVVISPLFVTIALLVVLDSPGPVFYRAERVGFRGRPLAMLKFRKMHRAARGANLTIAGDERLTRVGAWLARTKLDELPQLSSTRTMHTPTTSTRCCPIRLSSTASTPAASAPAGTSGS